MFFHRRGELHIVFGVDPINLVWSIVYVEGSQVIN